jgi:hypothetical protein
MAKSRSEVLASLRAIMGGAESETPAEKPKVVQPQPNGSKFGKFRKAPAPVAVVEEDEDEEEEFEEDEDESEVVDSDSNDTEEEVEESDDTGEVEVAPVEDLLDRVESLIDYISENSEALKSWIAACR